MIEWWQSLAFLGFGLWFGSIMALLLVRQNMQPRSLPVRRYAIPLHWIPTKQVTCVRKALEERGFLVLNLGSINGMTLVAKCEVAI